MSIIRKHSSERMSKINIHNGTIYFSGQVANDVTVGIKTQTQDCLKKIDALLLEAGSDRDNILSTTIFIRSMADFALMRRCLVRASLESNPEPLQSIHSVGISNKLFARRLRSCA